LISAYAVVRIIKSDPEKPVVIATPFENLMALFILSAQAIAIEPGDANLTIGCAIIY
jgi:hypothetical protein